MLIFLNYTFVFNGNIRIKIDYILKVPQVFLLGGIISPDINNKKNKDLVYIVIIVSVLTILNIIYSSHAFTMKEFIGYLIGGGILFFVLRVLPKLKPKVSEKDTNIDDKAEG